MALEVPFAPAKFWDGSNWFGAGLKAPVFSLVSRGGSDGSFAARFGVPTLDGLGAITHETCSRREYVEVSSIVPRAAILAGLMAAASEGRISPSRP